MSAILYFIVLVSVLIFVHEFGHYIVARLFKVKVLSFSIGMGPRAFGFERKNGEKWELRWLPIGGYVQMLGSDPTEETPDELKAVSFQFKPLWQRALIILAGPLFNLILPIPIFFAVMLATHTHEYPPVVGQVISGAPADGRLERGDEIIGIDGDEIRYWYQLVDRISASAEQSVQLKVARNGAEIDIEITPKRYFLRDELELTSRDVGRIGIVPSQYRAIVGITDPNGPAAKAGLQTFDKILSVNGKAVESYVEFEQALLKPHTDPIQLILLRENPAEVPFGRLAVLTPQRLTLDPSTLNPQNPTWGIDSAELFISQIDPDSPAATAGLLRGDQLTSLDGKSYNNFQSLLAELRKTWENPHKITVRRGTETLTLNLQLAKITVLGEFKEERPVITTGFYHRSGRIPPKPRELTFGDRLSYSATKSVETTVNASGVLVLAIIRMADGSLSRKSIGGPIMIGAMAGKAGEAGIEYFLQMMAYISINLGIVNLLPIPVLDGGHLLLFAMEGIKGGPLSTRTRQIASYIGLSMVIFLMLFAFKNDLERYWSDIVGFLG